MPRRRCAALVRLSWDGTKHWQWPVDTWRARTRAVKSLRIHQANKKKNNFSKFTYCCKLSREMNSLKPSRKSKEHRTTSSACGKLPKRGAQHDPEQLFWTQRKHRGMRVGSQLPTGNGSPESLDSSKTLKVGRLWPVIMMRLISYAISSTSPKPNIRTVVMGISVPNLNTKRKPKKAIFVSMALVSEMIGAIEWQQ